MSVDTDPEIDHWPTPDRSTYRKAVRAGIAASPDSEGMTVAEVDELVAKAVADPVFEAVVAAVWADRIPTPDAYHRACLAVEKHRHRAEVLAGEVDRLHDQVTALDGALHSIWLHGDWRWLTRNMTTEQREAAADAVERHWAAGDFGEYDEETLQALRWWRF